ncbi:MAG: thioredoxin domain-containing protein [Chitinophagia bacterium]
MSANKKFTNDLSKETSPYLLQHAHNPVQWKPWSETLFATATAADKPILLSIGYAACHWCHVMERESFEDEAVADYMNTHFINIKVDREERPDIDHIYMDALQAMTGSGGWPLNIFLLPNGQPFYGGTYFPPNAMQNRASWMDVLKGVQAAFDSNREKLVEQATHLTAHLLQTNIKVQQSQALDTIATKEEFQLIAERLLQNADTLWGGFGAAPKFPQTFSIQVLFRNYFQNNDQASIVHAIRSLDKMIQGGIYDHVGGGFSRYSVDAMWQAPHFEKMLYDNALILGTLAEAYQITKKPIYQEVIHATFTFLQRELFNGVGGYYAALDADSEGVEGKFYTWSYDELKAVIAPQIFDAFIAYYQVTPNGNWEHTNILWTQNVLEKEWEPALQNELKKLFDKRAMRVRPALDHKVILGWNAMLIVGFCKINAATGNELYKKAAIECMDWLEANLYHADEHYFYHSIANGTPKAHAFLDDYANLIQAYIQLQEMTGDINYLFKAKKWMDYVLLNFIDEDGLYFYYTASYQKDVIIRKKESYDGAQPSGNALICSSLYYLGLVFDLTEWRMQAEKMIHSIRPTLLQYPSSFGFWAQSFYQMSTGMIELVGVGPTVYESLSTLNAAFVPNSIRLMSQVQEDSIPLLKGKQCIENQFFICKKNSCSAPMSNVDLILANI